MATHFLYNVSGSVNLYRLPTNSSFSVNVSNSTNVDVVSEFEGVNCSFHKIQYNNNEYYVNFEDVKALEGTPQSAPYVCLTDYSTNFVEPDWTQIEVDIPYYNPFDKTYNIPFITNFTKLNDKNLFINDCLKTGVTKLLEYYYKDFSDETVEKLLSYYKFAYLKDYYVRPISNSRIKALVSIPRKYFDAVPALPNIVGIEDNMQVFSFSTKNFTNKLSYLKTIMNFYDKTVLSSNIKIQNFSFSNEFKRLITFYEKLLNLFSLNELVIDDDADDTVEIVLDNCGRFFCASLYQNNICRYPLISLNNFRKNQYSKNERTLNLLKNVDSIYYVDPCRFSFSNFIQRYILYPPDVSTLGTFANDTNNLNFESLLNYTKNLTEKLNSFSLEDEFTRATEETYSPQIKQAIFDLKKFYNWESFYNSEKDIFKDVNFNEDIVKLQNKKKDSGEDPSLTQSKIEKQTKNRRNTITLVYNILTINQFLCKLTPKAIKCLLSALASNFGIDSGANLSLSLASLTTYNIKELKTKVFPYLNKDEKRLLLKELLEQFCLTKLDLINVLKESKNLSKTDLQLYSTYNYDQVQQLILNEINV